MKKFIDSAKNQYKANLHCHSTLSDGRMTPVELKKAYKEQGYSVLAITDHEHLVEHHDLTEGDFLCLTAYEAHIYTPGRETGRNNGNPTAHLNFYSKKPHNKMVYYTPDIVYSRFIPDEKKENLEYYKKVENRDHSIEFVQGIVKDAVAADYLVCHCHPTWSFEDEDFADAYKDCFAMELYNHSSYTTGFCEYNQHYYDYQLRKGRKMAAIAADDNHDVYPLGDPKNDSFGGITYISAERLDYETIINSLEKKEFYASTGPRIFSIEEENGEFTVKTSAAERIYFITDTRHRGIEIAKEGEEINEANFTFGENDAWVRIEVVDHAGKRAFSRAYFKEEL